MQCQTAFGPVQRRQCYTVLLPSERRNVRRTTRQTCKFEHFQRGCKLCCGDPEQVGNKAKSPKPSVIVKSYRGSEASATAAFQKDAVRMAEQGYTPTSQSWAPGSWGCLSFLIALLLCVVLIGIVVFIYLLVVKPEGTLSVTYSLRSPTQSESQSSDATKVCPKCAETVKQAAIVCRFCGNKFEER